MEQYIQKLSKSGGGGVNILANSKTQSHQNQQVTQTNYNSNEV